MIACAAPTTSPVFVYFAGAGTYFRRGGGANVGYVDGGGRCGGHVIGQNVLGTGRNADD